MCWLLQKLLRLQLVGNHSAVARKTKILLDRQRPCPVAARQKDTRPGITNGSRAMRRNHALLA
jgi:hypothetical protein